MLGQVRGRVSTVITPLRMCRRISTARMEATEKKWKQIQSQSKNLLDEVADDNRVPAAVRNAILKDTLRRYRLQHVAEEWPKYAAKKAAYKDYLEQRKLFGGCLDSFNSIHSRLAEALALDDREHPRLPVMFLFSRLRQDEEFVQQIREAVEEQAKSLQ